MEVKELLKESGLNEYESRIYLALAKLSVGKASEIHKESKVPQNKVYEALVQLAEKGFIFTLNTTPRQYRIIGTEKFQQIIEDKEKKIKEMKGNVETLKQILTKKKFVTEEKVLILKTKKAIVEKLNSSTPGYQKYQYGLSAELKYYPKSARIIKEAIKRGVDFKFLTFKEHKNSQNIKKWKEIGVKIRFYSDPKKQSIRFSVYDDKVGRMTFGFPEVKSEEDYLTFWIESPAFSKMLRENFLNMWNNAEE